MGAGVGEVVVVGLVVGDALQIVELLEALEVVLVEPVGANREWTRSGNSDTGNRYSGGGILVVSDVVKRIALLPYQC